MNRHQELFIGNLVPADSVEDFAARYRKYDRYGSRSTEERAAIMGNHRAELAAYGITWVSHYDSCTGQCVAWMPGNVAKALRGMK